jgi:hypothetical protein
MDFNCGSDRHCVTRISQRQMFFRRIDGRVGAFSQVNQSLRWFVDTLRCLPSGARRSLE